MDEASKKDIKDILISVIAHIWWLTASVFSQRNLVAQNLVYSIRSHTVIFIMCIQLWFTNIWQVKVSVYTTNLVIQSTATCFGPHGTIIRHYYDRMAKVIELLNMDPYLV
jgi:ABC-type uncharacterized transport system permease subunit